jgi:hypothetical protein
MHSATPMQENEIQNKGYYHGKEAAPAPAKGDSFSDRIRRKMGRLRA